MNTNTSELLQLKKQYDQENELLQELEKNPMSEGQLNDVLGRGRTALEFATIQKRLSPLLDELRERKLIVDDSPMSFEEFKKANPNCKRKYQEHCTDNLKNIRNMIFS